MGTARPLKLSFIFLHLISILIPAPYLFDREDSEEIYLAFRYPGGVDAVLIVHMLDNQFYLPVTELFSLLAIDQSVDIQTLAITGYYLNRDVPYELNFKEYFIRIGQEKQKITSDDVLIKELDFYLKSTVLEYLFGLHFEINLQQLMIELETNKKMPIVEQAERRARRKKTQVQTQEMVDFPMISNRNPSTYNGGFLDYSASSRISETGNIGVYRVSLGGEFLSGDVQTTFMGTQTSINSFLALKNTRWRYNFTNNGNWIRQLYIGHNSSSGFTNQAYTGLKITNEPIIARVAYDDYYFDGFATPESDVELYLNNQIIAYQKADDQGYYHFLIPLTYGTSQFRLKIFSPNGGTLSRANRLQIPFTFLPTGELLYQFHAGKLENSNLSFNNQLNLIQTDVSYGLSNWVTGKIGLDYIEDRNTNKPILYNAYTARVFTSYLINLDIIPGHFYKINTSIVYPSQKSWSTGFTQYFDNGVYNLSGAESKISSNVFFPFNVNNQSITFLLNSSLHRFTNHSSVNYNMDLTSYINKIRVRFRYRGNDKYSNGPTLRQGIYSTSLMYTFPRTFQIPKQLRGLYLRTELRSKSNSSEIEKVELNISKYLNKKSRFYFALVKNLLQNTFALEARLTFDFDKFQSTSTLRQKGNISAFTQSVKGSVAYDRHYQKAIFDNRQQVGRSAVSVRLFVDENNSGIYETGEEILTPGAVRIQKTSSRHFEMDGVSRLMQLQSYRKYNFSIQSAKIKNPFMVPKIHDFSLITDPNSFKKIDIPFYMSGIIDGQVLRDRGNVVLPVAGLKLHLKSNDGEFQKVMKTFSDGAFYAMEIPPGQYEVWVDSTQLSFLQVTSSPAKIFFGVESLSDGDIIENLNFILKEEE